MFSSKSARLRALIVLVASLAVSGFAASAASANTPTTGLGINGWYVFWNMPQSQWDTQASQMAADGIKVVRADALWNSVEPSAPVAGVHSYNFAVTDAIVYSLARRGMQWLPIADYSASWAESVPGKLKSPPADDGAYAAYAAALVSRYGPGGSFWPAHPGLAPRPVTAVEIWNEENLVATAVPASAYATLYEDARAAIHAVNPSVEAVVGGLGNPAATYLNQMYATLGGPGQIDAVADHPYDLSPSGTYYDVSQLRYALDGRGDTNVPIDVTEFGYPTSGTASWTTTMTDAQRATAMTQTIDTLSRSDCGIERILPYSWLTAQANTGNPNDWFGISNLNGTPTQTSAAVAQEYASLVAAGAPASAGIAICKRPLTLTLTQVAVPSGSTGNVCVRATALSWSSAGWATVGISGSAVRYAAPSVAAAITNGSGQATTCFTLPAGTAATVAASATQPSFLPVATASLLVSAPASITG